MASLSRSARLCGRPVTCAVVEVRLVAKLVFPPPGLGTQPLGKPATSTVNWLQELTDSHQTAVNRTCLLVPILAPSTGDQQFMKAVQDRDSGFFAGYHE